MIQKYYIENDLIETSGSDALKKLGVGGNEIYINLKDVERIADDKSNENSEQYQEVLDYINKGENDFQNKRITLANKGILRWNYENLKEEERKKINHITRKKGRSSFLIRNGYHCQYPEFLKFGPERFKTSLIDIGYNQKIDDLKLNDLQDSNQIEFMNNQLIRINNSDDKIFRVKYNLDQSGSAQRYHLDENSGTLIPFNNNKYGNPANFVPRNIEQNLGINSLMDKNIELHFIVGGSGSGKTVLGYAGALSHILSKKGKTSLDGIILFKSNDIIGGKSREQGFLPGSAYEKLKPHMKSIIDAHTLLNLNGKGGIPFSELLADPYDERDEFGKRKLNKIFSYNLPPKTKAIEIEHLQYARGRTFENSVVLVDETQNYTPFEIKQLIERVGNNSKIILIGDTEQIDNPQLNRDFNGLTYALNVFHNVHPRMSLTYLDQNYRSQSADMMRVKKAPKT